MSRCEVMGNVLIALDVISNCLHLEDCGDIAYQHEILRAAYRGWSRRVSCKQVCKKRWLHS